MSQQGEFMCCGGRLHAARESLTRQLSVQAPIPLRSMSCDLIPLLDVCLCVVVVVWSNLIIDFWQSAGGTINHVRSIANINGSSQAKVENDTLWRSELSEWRNSILLYLCLGG